MYATFVPCRGQLLAGSQARDTRACLSIVRRKRSVSSNAAVSSTHLVVGARATRVLTTEGLGGVVRGDGLLGKTEVGEARMAHLGSSSSSSSCCSS